jgi:small-conductance mechanosensitive channel
MPPNIAAAFESAFLTVTAYSTMWYVGVGVLLGWVAYRTITSRVERHLLKRAYSKENVQNFLLFWRYGWLFFAALILVVILSGSFASAGISAAFLGTMLGWSLQAPVTGIAAWLMVILKRPFKIGDRIIINGITGDVRDITLTHIHLNQVGGTIGGEEESGRSVLIPNAILFQHMIYNYTLGKSKHILDELVVTITFQSDFEAAKSVLLAAATAVTAEIIKDIKKDPFTRVEITDSGILIRLRYQTIPRLRQQISSDIATQVIQAVTQSKKIRFAHPHRQIV